MVTVIVAGTQYDWDGTDVYCPSCGRRPVWVEAGGCYLCASCGHSFHYSNPLSNYISDAESAQMLVAVRTA
jgi:ribosomal protein L37AE/L43A